MSAEIISLTKYIKDRGLNPDGDLGNMTWQLGEKIFFAGVECVIQAPGKGEDAEDVVHRIGRFIWPLAEYEDSDSQTRGVVVRYITSSGDNRLFLAPAGSFSSNQAAAKMTEHAFAQGVQLYHQQARNFSELLHSFVMHYQPKPQTYRLVKRPGWHQMAYVNGEYIIPAGKKICADRSSSIIANRSGRSGSLSGWVRAIEDEVTTPGLRAALGVSLAGPIVQMLGKNSFGVHYYAQTSVGKSTASIVASSIWGAEIKIKQSFNTTQNGLEAAAEQANGACLVMDEIGQFRGGPEQLGNAIYDLMSQQGRQRLTQSGEQRQRREWSFSMLSNGEISVMDIVGDALKGGQMVRLMDVEIELGELTKDARHSERIVELLSGSPAKPGNYGHVSDQWIHYLIERKIENITATWEDVRMRLKAALADANAEDGRMLNGIANIGTALVEGVRAGILAWDEAASMETTLWLARRVINGRRGENAMDTPERRMLRRWLELVETEPGKFPAENDERMPAMVYGYRTRIGNIAYICTTEAMLNKTGLPKDVGVSARRFFAWAEDEKIIISDKNRQYLAGTQQRWKRYKIGNMSSDDDI